MIYHDKVAQYDRVEFPGYRVDSNGDAEKCINCGKDHDDHDGWRCKSVTVTNKRKFQDLNSHERYLTASMVASIPHPPSAVAARSNATFCAACSFAKIAHTASTSGNLICPVSGKIGYWTEPVTTAVPIQKPKEKEVDISDWRAWAHNRPGECACGIPKERCEYHK